MNLINAFEHGFQNQNHKDKDKRSKNKHKKSNQIRKMNIRM